MIVERLSGRADCRRVLCSALLAGLLLAACGGSSSPAANRTGDGDSGPTNDAPSALDADEIPATPGSSSPSDEPTASNVLESCRAMEAQELSTVTASALTEASGLAVSSRHEGVIWTHNDNGRDPAVIALDFDGNLLAELPLPGVSGLDLEDLALVDGTLYLGDIGDNLSERDTISVYRFTEPDPRSSEGITSVDELRLTYPDRAFDAESLLVDPLSGQLVIITKTVRIGGSSAPLSAAAAPVFVAEPPFDTDSTIVLEQHGSVALDELSELATGQAPEGRIRSLGVADVATAADIRADGATIAVRTYRSVWLFAREDGRSVAEALAGPPCLAATNVEIQGEAVAFVDLSSDAFITVSEGSSPAINLTR